MAATGRACPRSVEGRIWDARANHDLGVLIERYLTEHPPPADARFAPDFRCWGERLRADGHAHLRELGVSHLRSAVQEGGA